MAIRIATVTTIALLALLASAASAAADTAVIQVANGSLPWTDPNHQSVLETFTGPIATHVANRQVSIRCEGQTDWDQLNKETGMNGAELGYVLGLWPVRGGVPFGGSPAIASFAEISPRVCTALQTFALAAVKPTKCVQTRTVVVAGTTTVTKSKNMRVRVQVTKNGRTIWKYVTKVVKTTVDVPTDTSTQVIDPPAPCYANHQQLTVSDPAFWTNYKEYAYAVLTLAHESIHLGGMVGGTVNGYPVGDQLAEAKAQCYGMQWMPWVAQQLGAAPDDALALAQWTYDILYPFYRGGLYWSGDCVPGGALDIRGDKSASAVWP